MDKCKNIDKKNNYIPNLNNINECALRQFLEGNIFLEMAINTIDKYSKIENKELIYDISNAVASTLAFACESFLKALYLFEHDTKETNVKIIWENLRKPEKIDATRNKKKVKGHDLDILIDNLSIETKTLLETRLLTINKEKTEKYDEVTIYDILLKNKKIGKQNLLNENQYYSWLEHHKRTFEKSRYGGQLYHKVNLEFLMHLAVQICAVAQYKICPTEEQKNFNKFEHIKELPDEIITLFHLKNDYIDENLITLISKNKEKKEEFIKIINNNIIINMLIKQNSIPFYKIIKYFNYEEIELIVNYLNKYNSNKKFEQKDFICFNELDGIKFIPIKMFFLVCFIAKTEYNIDITQTVLIDFTNICLKKEINSTQENILKLARNFKN